MVMLSYVHVDGDFDPQRVTAARVHGGLHPQKVHKEATLLIPPWLPSRKDWPHSGRSSRGRRSPCPYKLLGSTSHHVTGSQVIHNQPRRHHSSKGNRCVVDDELLALVLQKIVSPTPNHSLTDLAWGGEGFEWKANWGRLEIKVHMVGMKWLDLNTRVSGSLPEN